jgi:hypothetical protein
MVDEDYADNPERSFLNRDSESLPVEGYSP